MSAAETLAALFPEERREFEAAAVGRVLIRCCVDCGTVAGYSAMRCSGCGRAEPEPVDASGAGAVYAVTTVPRPGAGLEGPVSVVLVDLVEGPRVIGRARDTDLAIGDPVRAVAEPLGDGLGVVVWERAGDS